MAHTMCLPGMSYVLNANSSNYGNVFVILEPFHDRHDSALGGDAIASQLRARLAREVPEARVLVFGAPPISGLGTSAGFKLMVEATGDVNFDALQAEADKLGRQGEPAARPGRAVQWLPRPDAATVRRYRPREGQVDGRDRSPMFSTHCRHAWAATTSTTSTASAAPGRSTSRPTLRSAPTRKPSSSSRCATPTGDMVPLGAVAEVRDSAGPVQITRYNMFPTASINGLPLPGTSTGEALASMERLSQDLPRQHDHRVDRSELPAEAGEQDRADPGPAQQSHSAPSWWGWCSYSSCWPACTRVGRCRGR